MAENNSVSEMMEKTIKNMKTMIDVNTIIGDAVTAPDGTIIIPISKVSFGFAGGGGDKEGKQEAHFNGGMGGGGSVKAEAFLVINNSNVRLIPMGGGSSPVDKLVDMLPGAMDKVNAFLSDRKKKG